MNADYSFEDLHEALYGRRVDITLQDERTISSTALLIRSDTTWAVDRLSGRVRVQSTDEIRYITHRRPGRGAVQGAGIGAMIGTVTGLVTGFALTGARESEGARTSLAYYVSVPTIFGTLLGAGAGTLFGMHTGSHDRYVYPEPPGMLEPGPRPVPAASSAQSLPPGSDSR